MTSYPLGFRVAQAVGISGAAWLSGNIAAISLIGTPAIIQSQKEENVSRGLLARQWKSMYDNGKSQNPPIALCVSSAFLYLAWSVRAGSPLYKKTSISRAGLFSAAAAFTLCIVPYTFVAMSSTNNKLLENSESSSEFSDKETLGLVQRWTTLNQVRGFLPLVGGFCGIAASFL
ncbi:hypothetical protein N7532_006074 [Penicillium argentinense]|uniref:DUF1772-domain-containing protein n=1 Tax=Penicillium argentinense TaxID=1131581 RepID=A0A9W9KAK6_9EURO|nr:uncharacterized protein N7532_006074 [Penicillium argentinense]KAJ5099073.1 hypothetical protein N7532_006074 [Penicillium argentinense]